MVRLLLLIMLIILPELALAGPWPREKRKLFIAASYALGRGDDGVYPAGNSLYMEYGLTDKMTLGLDSFLGQRDEVSEGYFFGRHPIGKTGGASRLAFSFGLGYKSIPNPWGTKTKQYLTKPGLHWGRGLQKGWLGIDVSVTHVLDSSIYVPNQAGTSYFADYTWGLKPRPRLMLINQLQTGKITNGDAFAKFAPSLVWTMTRSNPAKIEIGLIKGLVNDESQQLKLGFWSEF